MSRSIVFDAATSDVAKGRPMWEVRDDLSRKILKTPREGSMCVPELYIPYVPHDSELSRPTAPLGNLVPDVGSRLIVGCPSCSYSLP